MNLFWRIVVAVTVFLFWNVMVLTAFAASNDMESDLSLGDKIGLGFLEFFGLIFVVFIIAGDG